MSGRHGTETEFELTTLKRLEALGYRPVFGMDLPRPPEQVVLKDVLRTWLAKSYPELPASALDEAVHTHHPPGRGGYPAPQPGFSPTADAWFRPENRAP